MDYGKWRYFPENEPVMGIFAIRLFDDGSAIILQGVCSNRKFVADVLCSTTDFREKNANFEFCFDCKGAQAIRTGVG
jgi:hypothetical protein